MMRNILFSLSFVLVTFMAVSCNLGTVISPSVQASSQLYRSYTVIGSLGQDSIVQDTITYKDSLSIGDTVRWPMVINGYYDYLVSFKATADTNDVRLSFAWDPVFDTLLIETSDYSHGVLEFKPAKVYAGLVTLVYVPRRSGTHQVDLVLNSAAQEPYSQWAGHFNMAVK